jgi:hypothetical protein
MPAGRELAADANRLSHLREPGFASCRPRSSSTAGRKSGDRAPADAWPRRCASRHRHIQKAEDFGPISR